jgi:hypothetical protein
MLHCCCGVYKYGMQSKKTMNGGYHDMVVQCLHNILQQKGVDHAFIPNLEFCVPLPQTEYTKNKIYILPTCDQVSQHQIQHITNKIKPYPNNSVLILTAVQNLRLDYPDLPENISFMHIGGDMLFQMDQYPMVDPCKGKNLDMTRFWISLSNNPKSHRVLTACCLLGQNLGFDQTHEPQTGLLRLSSDHQYKQVTDLYDQFAQLDPDQQNILINGFERLRQGKNGGQPGGRDYATVAAINEAGRPDNVQNFNLHLRHLYKNSLIELINETTFFNKGTFVTEKFLNSVYGYNLPIVFSTPGTVEYLRQNGFDMFDDVIDHSYDVIQDPVQRIFSAIESNKRLLTDKQHAWTTWKNCVDRMDANHAFAKEHMYNHFIQLAEKQLVDFLDQHVFGAPGRI